MSNSLFWMASFNDAYTTPFTGGVFSLFASGFFSFSDCVWFSIFVLTLTHCTFQYSFLAVSFGPFSFIILSFLPMTCIAIHYFLCSLRDICVFSFTVESFCFSFALFFFLRITRHLHVHCAGDGFPGPFFLFFCFFPCAGLFCIVNQR